MNRNQTYKAGLTREQFLFHEMRITARLLYQGYSKEAALAEIKRENLFQFPTGRMIKSIARTCFRRYEMLHSQILQQALANGSFSDAKQIHLYAIMRDNALVWDFFVCVIGEKYRIQDFNFSKIDIHRFYAQLQEQNDAVHNWSDSTASKIKQVLKKNLAECGYLETIKSNRLCPVFLCPVLKEGIWENRDMAAFPAFNYFT